MNGDVECRGGIYARYTNEVWSVYAIPLLTFWKLDKDFRVLSVRTDGCKTGVTWDGRLLYLTCDSNTVVVLPVGNKLVAVEEPVGIIKVDDNFKLLVSRGILLKQAFISGEQLGLEKYADEFAIGSNYLIGSGFVVVWSGYKIFVYKMNVGRGMHASFVWHIGSYNVVNDCVLAEIAIDGIHSGSDYLVCPTFEYWK